MGRMVCQLGGSLKYRVYSRPVDMRKSFRGLAGIVHSEIGRQLSPEDVYVFVGKNRRTLKLLHREGHGLTLYTRKLDGVCFPKIEVDEEKNECVISYATFIKMAIGERLWGKMGVYICRSL
uniref:IS66 family insertion sequence element accessory protein TnpB n=1 Tax=Prevotella sp. TaxID=59823 RepID=UPI0040288078